MDWNARLEEFTGGRNDTQPERPLALGGGRDQQRRLDDHAARHLQASGAGLHLAPSGKHRVWLLKQEGEDLRKSVDLIEGETITDVFRGYAINEDEEDMTLTFTDCNGNPACDKTKIETGLESITEYEKKLAETTALTSKLALFFPSNNPTSWT